MPRHNLREGKMVSPFPFSGVVSFAASPAGADQLVPWGLVRGGEREDSRKGIRKRRQTQRKQMVKTVGKRRRKQRVCRTMCCLYTKIIIMRMR